jgi:zinc transport system ATP-binding protein
VSVVVKVCAVSSGYGADPILHGVDLEVSAGQVVALLGTNGSGKSTLVKTVVGLIPLRAGSVELFGTPLSQFRDWRCLGYVPQRTTAAAGVPATVTEIVAAGRLPRIPWWRSTSKRDREAVQYAIDQVDLSGLERQPVAELSGGQQQRVLFARALATEPDLLVLDEPTAGVDLVTQQILATSLAERVGAGAAVLLVAHELGPMLPLIDRAVVLREGHVAYDGALTSDMVGALEADHVHPHGPEVSPDSWGLR